MNAKLVEVRVEQLALAFVEGQGFISVMTLGTEEGGTVRTVLLLIGGLEARSIELARSGQKTPRPLTHELHLGSLAALKASLQNVAITEMRPTDPQHPETGGTYYARLRLRRGDELVEVDSRPSDAVALALTAGVPIFCAEDLLNSQGVEVTTVDDLAEGEIDATVPAGTC